MQHGRPIALKQTNHSSAERNDTTGEQVLLAAVHACQIWRSFIEGAVGDTIITDHNFLKFLNGKGYVLRQNLCLEDKSVGLSALNSFNGSTGWAHSMLLTLKLRCVPSVAVMYAVASPQLHSQPATP